MGGVGSTSGGWGGGGDFRGPRARQGPWNTPEIIDIYCVRALDRVPTFCNGGPRRHLSHNQCQEVAL